MKITLTSLFLLFSSSLLYSQIVFIKDLKEARDISKNVTELFQKNEISEGFDLLEPHWPLPENELEALEEKTIKYLNILPDRFGEAEGIAKIKEEKIGDFALRETYLIRYQVSAIRLIFTYFQNKDGWILNGFKWDDNFGEEFD